ncbi:MAG: alpha/beta hydrolase [Acidobacteria bacterium]|nr:alpha/beta hydrolase [Acidobacteriota bacterium]
MKTKLQRAPSAVASIFVLLLSLAGSLVGEVRGQTAVSYLAEDGWKIQGTLYLPERIPQTPMPGVILMTEPGWIDRSTFAGYLAIKLTERNVAALAIDFRGMGGSLGKKDFVMFSEKDLQGLRLDIQGAVKFLTSHPGVDPSRIALLGTGLSAHYAALEAAENTAVKALVMLSAVLEEDSRKSIQARAADLPILSIIGKGDKKRFQAAADVFSLSKNPDSDFLMAKGHGTSMFSHTPGLEEKVVEWLDHNLKALGAETEVSFRSEDGWTLQGTLRIPGGVSGNSKVPGVVLVHGAKHDQQTYYQLTQELAKKGMASLRFDWRGKGRSIAEGKGKYGFDLSAEETERIPLDVKAAIEMLASQPGVDASRIGLIAATAGTGRALRAAYGDDRIQTVVLLTSNLAPEGEAKQFLTTSGKPIFAIASTEDVNYNRGSLAEETRQAYLFSNSKESEFLLYDDAGRGSEMLKSKPELERMVVRWFAEKLSAGKPVTVGLEFSQDRR